MNAYANSIQFCHFSAERTQMAFTITLRGEMLMSATKCGAHTLAESGVQSFKSEN